jgi:hypothetical protein
LTEDAQQRNRQITNIFTLPRGAAKSEIIRSLAVRARDVALGFFFVGALISYPPKLERKVVMPEKAKQAGSNNLLNLFRD